MPLLLTIESNEFWDPVNCEFVSVKPQKIVLEHSLVSISKWEAKWHIPFIEDGLKTQEHVEHYIQCMTITQNVDPLVFKVIAYSPDLLKQVTDYISDPMTATWFNETKKPSKFNREKLTSELIYYLMIAYNIPSEYQKWHLNRLLTLIRICSIKNEPPKKMSKSEIFSSNRALNAARRKALGTKG